MYCAAVYRAAPPLSAPLTPGVPSLDSPSLWCLPGAVFLPGAVSPWGGVSLGRSFRGAVSPWGGLSVGRSLPRQVTGETAEITILVANAIQASEGKTAAQQHMLVRALLQVSKRTHDTGGRLTTV